MERRAAGQAGYAAYMRDLLKSSDRRGQGLVSMERDGGVGEGEKKKSPCSVPHFFEPCQRDLHPLVMQCGAPAHVWQFTSEMLAFQS